MIVMALPLSPRQIGGHRVRVSILHDAIRRAGLATLVSLTEDGLIASHVPPLLDPEPGPYGMLLGHLARANPQARPISVMW
jgi:transcriptional regulator